MTALRLDRTGRKRPTLSARRSCPYSRSSKSGTLGDLQPQPPKRTQRPNHTHRTKPYPLPKRRDHRHPARGTLPAARIVEDLEQPLVIEGHPVTFWHLIVEGDRKATYGELGGLLRDLHSMRVPEGLELPSFDHRHGLLLPSHPPLRIDHHPGCGDRRNPARLRHPYRTRRTARRSLPQPAGDRLCPLLPTPRGRHLPPRPRGSDRRQERPGHGPQPAPALRHPHRPVLRIRTSRWGSVPSPP